MGKLLYGPAGHQYEIEDRALAHLQMVIVAKVRRGESFTFTWDSPRESGHGRVVLWMFPALPLQFVYSGSRIPDLNRTWVESLMQAANSGAGLRVLPEPARSAQNAPPSGEPEN